MTAATTHDDSEAVKVERAIDCFLIFFFVIVTAVVAVAVRARASDTHMFDDHNADGEINVKFIMASEWLCITLSAVAPHPTRDALVVFETKDFLNTCIMICRQCHSKIHPTKDEQTPAREYNTLEKIMEHPEIIRWVGYASKQKARIKPVEKSKYPVGKRERSIPTFRRQVRRKTELHRRYN